MNNTQTTRPLSWEVELNSPHVVLTLRHSVVIFTCREVKTTDDISRECPRQLFELVARSTREAVHGENRREF